MTVLLFGCPRSGTSILGEMFEHVPGWQFYLEPPLGRVEHLDYTHWQWALKNPIGGDTWTPGLACDLDALMHAVPDPTVVFIIRHPLDTICSMRPAMASGIPHGPVPSWAWDEPDVLIRAASVWNYVNTEGYDALPKPYLIRFEELAQTPTLVTAQLLDHLGCPPPPDIHQYTSLLSNKTGGYEAKHQDRWVTKDHNFRIGRWHHQLTIAEAERVWPLVQETAGRFGYAN